MFTALTASVQPYLVWIKILAVLAIAALLFGGGYHYGSLVTHSKDTVALNSLQKQYDADKQVWSDTKTRMAADALAVLTAHDQANAAKELADQTKIQSLATKYQSALKEVQNAKQAALARVTHPAPGTDDGLWVDVDTSSCAGDPDGRDLVSQASTGRQFSLTQQCRLSSGSASWLVEEAARANEIVAKYNECVGSIQVTTEPDSSHNTTTQVDTQGATK